MTPTELQDWLAFYRLHPFDDMHRYLRPAAMVADAVDGAAARFGGEKLSSIAKRLEWLEPPSKVESMLTEADLNTLKAFNIKR